MKGIRDLGSIMLSGQNFRVAHIRRYHSPYDWVFVVVVCFFRARGIVDINQNALFEFNETVIYSTNEIDSSLNKPNNILHSTYNRHISVLRVDINGCGIFVWHHDFVETVNCELIPKINKISFGILLIGLWHLGRIPFIQCCNWQGSSLNVCLNAVHGICILITKWSPQGRAVKLHVLFYS